MLSMQPLKFFLLLELGFPENGMPPKVIFKWNRKWQIVTGGQSILHKFAVDVFSFFEHSNTANERAGNTACRKGKYQISTAKAEKICNEFLIANIYGSKSQLLLQLFK